MTTLVSCCLSAAGIGFLDHPVPGLGSAFLAVGAPGQNDPDQGGVSTFHMRKTRPGRVPPRSRGGGVHATSKMPPVAACRFAAASPAPRSSIHPPEAHLDETIRRFTRVHPSGLPLAYAPRWITGRFSFFPELRTPPLPATHVRAGTGHEHLPGLRHRRHRQPPHQRATCTCDLVSHHLGDALPSRVDLDRRKSQSPSP